MAGGTSAHVSSQEGGKVPQSLRRAPVAPLLTCHGGGWRLSPGGAVLCFTRVTGEAPDAKRTVNRNVEET
jgi:hypothetical protein